MTNNGEVYDKCPEYGGFGKCSTGSRCSRKEEGRKNFTTCANYLISTIEGFGSSREITFPTNEIGGFREITFGESSGLRSTANVERVYDGRTLSTFRGRR